MGSKLFSAKSLIILVLLLIIAAISIIFYTNRESTNGRPPLNPNHKLPYVGAISYFSSDSGIKSFKENFRNLDYISLFWYQVNSNGSISRRDQIKSEVENDILAFARQKNAKVLVGIENDEDAEKIDTILEDEGAREAHISEILKLLQDKSYDGVVIDYESLRQEQAEGFTEYMQQLSVAVRAVGGIVSISVNTETSGRVFHGIDIVEVSKVVDRLELNAYEEFGKESGPGPIASIDWVNTTIKNVIDQGVEPSKIILGTAHAGHDWITSPSEEFFKDTSAHDALHITSDSDSKWDETTQSTFFKYKDTDGREHVVWLEDSRSFEAKIDLAKSYELQGVFIWYLGGEDEKVWEVLSSN